MLTLLALALLAQSPQPPATEMNLSLVGVGRFANLVDTASLKTGPDGVEIRNLQVSQDDMLIGYKAYVGGWSWWRFDCPQGTADRLDFAALTSDLIEGPRTPENQPPFPASPGGDAAEILAIACGQTVPPKGTASLSEAIRMARQAMAD